MAGTVIEVQKNITDVTIAQASKTEVNVTLETTEYKPADFYVFNSMQDLKDEMNASKQASVRRGVIKGLTLLGYYQFGDTPAPITYYPSTTQRPANDIDVVQVGSLKFEHNFNGLLDVSYAGIKGDATDETSKIQAIIDLFPEVINNKDIYANAVKINKPTKISGNGKIYTLEANPAVNITSSDVTIDGLEISSPSGGGDSRSIGLGTTSFGSPVIKNVTISNCIISNVLWYSNVENLKIQGNKFFNGSVTCWFGYYNRVIISDNIIDNDVSYKFNGINATNTYGVPEGAGIRNIIVSGNIIKCYRMGFEWRDRNSSNSLDNNVSGILSNNQIHIKGSETENQHPFGVSLNSGGWTISNNVVTKELNDKRGYGMEIVQSANNTIIGNEVRDFNEGIIIYEASPRSNPQAINNVVNNNRIYNCGANSIRVWRGSSKTTMIGNYIYMSTGSLYGINIEGDQSNADSNLGKKVSICREIIVQGNIIEVEVDPTDNRPKRIVNITSAENVNFTGNSITLRGESIDNTTGFSIIGVYLGRADNVSVRQNTITGTFFNTKNTSAGIAVAEANGRNQKIQDNTITNFARDIFQAGSGLTYEVLYQGNTVSNRMFTSTLAERFKYSMTDGKSKKTASSPEFGVYAVGDKIYKTDYSSYFLCTTGGSIKTISDITATFTTSSTLITVSKTVGLEVGDWIRVQGGAFPLRIVDIDFNNLTVTVNRTAGATGTAVLTFQAPVFKEIAL